MVCLLATLAFSIDSSAPIRDQLVNQGWAFRREPSVGGKGPTELARDHAFDYVSLPHPARLEDDTERPYRSYQGTVHYRRKFLPSPSWRGKRVALKVEGAMQVADVYVNGKFVTRHTGGYLPFEIDLSDTLGSGLAADVELKLNNEDNTSFPPGRPQGALDFTYAGGLYRDVWLEVTPTSYIRDIYAYSKHVSPMGADVVVMLTTVGQSRSALVELSDSSGRKITEVEVPLHSQRVSAGSISESSATVHLKKFQFWDLDHPVLYSATVKLREPSGSDQRKVRFGIRKLEFDHQRGAFLNGKPLRLEGSNRHMAFPVIGNAASDDAQFREAKRLKGLGLNTLRLAHYPQSPAFLEACDELGLLVIDPIPGWQFFQNTPEFKSHVLQDVRETVLRDRNHPCVAIFETCLNETYNAPDSFWGQCNQVAHEVFGEGNFFTGGDSYGKRDYSKPIWDVPWTGWDDDQFTRPALFKMQKGIDREYGDYEFGGEQSTSRAARGDGEGALMLQAWNFIWSHNRNRGNQWSFGDLTWEAIDTFRGMSQASPISHSGLLDLFRLPKPVAFFYQSQGLTKPMVHIANEWTQRVSPTKVVVFSNCDQVELRLNGQKIARQHPDSGPTTGYLGPAIADPLYWAHGKGEIVPANHSAKVVGGAVGALPFSGGNSEFLRHPPFTFDGIKYVAGKLDAIGFIKGKPISMDTVYTPGKEKHLRITVDTEGRQLRADGADFVFVYVSIMDENGQVIPSESSKVWFKVTGNGHSLGSTCRPAEAGIAPFMVQSNCSEGKIVIEARDDAGHSQRVTITSRI